MGLDTSHDCWHGPYSAFMRFRQAVCKAAHGEDLKAMWQEESLPKDDPLTVLLNHSDCDGEIANEHCLPIAQRLYELVTKLDREHRDSALQFAGGLMDAHDLGESVEFH